MQGLQQLISILGVTFPIFALVACGFVAIRRGLLPMGAIPGLSAYILSFALPALLFRLGIPTPIADLLDLPLILVYGGAGLALFGLTVVLSRNERIGLKDAAFGAFVSVYPNAGFMGIPLLLALFGETGVRVILVTLLVDCFVISSTCLSIVRADGRTSAPGGIVAAAVGALRGAAANPLLWPIAAGLLCGFAGITVPAPVGKAISMLADTASPVALFAIGCILARQAASATQEGSALPRKDYVPVALTKLFVHPAAIFGIGLLVQRIGLALDDRSLIVLTLVAALPPAINVSMLAERFGADAGRIARIIMLATVLSFVTFTAAVWSLGVSPAAA